VPVAKREDIECHDGATENDPRVYVINGQNYRSVTSVLRYDAEGSYYLEEWFKKNGLDSDRQRDESGLVGSVFHKAAEDMVTGGRVVNDSLIYDLKLGLSDLAVKYDARTLSHSTTLFKRVQRCLQGLTNFWLEYKPDTIAAERVVYADKIGRQETRVSGSLDLECVIDGVPTVIDFKTSKSIHQSYLVQSSVYSYMLWGEDQHGEYQGDDWYKGRQVGVLHLGNSTKQLYSWKVVPDKHRNRKDVPGFLNRFGMLSDLHALDFPKVKPKEETLYPTEWSL
tara:strand:- start:17788 stop:18630 length:843 start_codon:yes stop_codon:yes gene_type:complete